MVGLTPEQRKTLIDKLADAANLALGALVFGQFLAEQPFSTLAAIGGLVVWASLLAFVLVLGGQR